MVSSSNNVLQAACQVCLSAFVKFDDSCVYRNFYAQCTSVGPCIEVATWKILAASISLFSVILLFMVENSDWCSHEISNVSKNDNRSEYYCKSVKSFHS